MNPDAAETFTATPDQADRRLDRVLRGLFRDVPLGTIMKAIRKGSVRLNGAKTSADARLSDGDVVSTPWTVDTSPAHHQNHLTKQSAGPDKKLTTLFRNDDLWCVDKPAGLLSQPDRAGGDSLITRAWEILDWSRRDFRPALIGRLDRNVSGAEAIAMNAPALRALSEAMREGRINKIYAAVVCGNAPEEGEIDIPLIKDSQRNVVRAAKSGEKGLDALSKFRKLSGNGRYSLLEVNLITGRPHQARVHLASAGHPIVGDIKYGARGGQAAHRLMLHAQKISFSPDSGLPDGLRGLEIVSPLPGCFDSLWDSKSMLLT
jgi:23S rRNA pseudouridine955/2504/2580 synthase